MSTKYTPLFASLLAALGFTVTANAQEIVPPYSYNNCIAVEAPVIDGVLDDSTWASALTTTPFVVHDDGSAASGVTTAKVAYDQNYLYIAFESKDSDIAATFTEQDDPTFSLDDTVEIFLDPDGDGKNYYEIGVTPLAYYDYVIHQPDPWSDDVDWDIEGFEYAVVVDGTLNDSSDIDEGFTVEVKIPLASLNYTSADEATDPSKWRFNLHKASYDTGAAKWNAQWLAWSPIGSFGFHQPTKFASLDFTDVNLWQPKVVYSQDQTASYAGIAYIANYYSAAAAPGMSSLDGWSVLGEIVTPYNANLIYTKGDVVTFNGQQWQANWWTQSAFPGLTQDWTAL